MDFDSLSAPAPSGGTASGAAHDAERVATLQAQIAAWGELPPEKLPLPNTIRDTVLQAAMLQLRLDDPRGAAATLHALAALVPNTGSHTQRDLLNTWLVLAPHASEWAHLRQATLQRSVDAWKAAGAAHDAAERTAYYRIRWFAAVGAFLAGHYRAVAVETARLEPDALAVFGPDFPVSAAAAACAVVLAAWLSQPPAVFAAGLRSGVVAGLADLLPPCVQAVVAHADAGSPGAAAHRALAAAVPQLAAVFAVGAPQWQHVLQLSHARAVVAYLACVDRVGVARLAADMDVDPAAVPALVAVLGLPVEVRDGVVCRVAASTAGVQQAAQAAACETASAGTAAVVASIVNTVKW